MHSLSSKSAVYLDIVLYVHLKIWLCIALNRMFIHILGYPYPFLKNLIAIMNKTMKLYKKLKSFSSVGNQINLSRYKKKKKKKKKNFDYQQSNHYGYKFFKGHNKNSRHIHRSFNLYPTLQITKVDKLWCVFKLLRAQLYWEVIDSNLIISN